jgi:hypothetical protein
MGKKRGGSVQHILVEDPNHEGQQVKHTTQESVHQAIFDNIHRKRFFLTEDAPICQGKLRIWFGYNSVSEMAGAVLDGTFVYPDDFDKATKEICRECAAIRALIPINSLNILITIENWQQQWQGCRESTSSSEPGLHFGHYLAGILSSHISHFRALKALLILKRGIILNRWARGLSVMLEKIFGCALVMKLCLILLMEADFNATNKIIYGQQMMNTVQKYKFMPEEIFSKKNRLADDGTLAKVLFYDIV